MEKKSKTKQKNTKGKEERKVKQEMEKKREVETRVKSMHHHSVWDLPVREKACWV